MRIDGRKPNEIREIKIIPSANPYAEGSVEVSFGRTKVLVTATVEKEVPRWMEQGQGGWITAEYGMLPRATHSRNKREASAGKQGGRTLEIQRLIGRALRQAVDLKALEGLSVRIDCDVLCADGGTRTASITGGWVALYQAIEWAKNSGLVEAKTEVKPVAAISVGRVNGQNLVDLCYAEDSNAEFDLNIVADSQLNLIEIQGTGEKAPISKDNLIELIALSEPVLIKIFEEQKRAVNLL